MFLRKRLLINRQTDGQQNRKDFNHYWRVSDWVLITYGTLNNEILLGCCIIDLTETQRLYVNMTVSGFDSHLGRLNYFHFPSSNKVKRSFDFLHLTSNASKGKKGVTLGSYSTYDSFCLPCYVIKRKNLIKYSINQLF